MQGPAFSSRIQFGSIGPRSVNHTLQFYNATIWHFEKYRKDMAAFQSFYANSEVYRDLRDTPMPQTYRMTWAW